MERVAVITGAGSGIGRATAHTLAAAGYAVVVSDISEEAGEMTVSQIQAAGGMACFIRVDAGCVADNDALVAKALSEYGRLDAAVNNAGLGTPPAVLHEMSDEAFNRAIDVTVRGTFYGMRAQLAHFASVGEGAIVNIASIAGLRASPHLSPYVSAKHGVVGLTQTAALDYAHAGIRINAVAPGPIRTAAFASLPAHRIQAEQDKVPMKRLGEPEDVAAAVSWLLSADASFVTGVVLPVDGGSLLA
ncbi:short-chain dehydrogenase [Corynebacterium aquilae DSM 44791]|uniref:Short-chain dehydrogenase n=1 Tax=Corynebacterium aquilae DSM 44791 TaxID=1431546 RepID=A0A1L7CFS8_9CORY|nr:short-chain dehydrogenase [Corynebacterium aquilae DSM 44791]